MSNWWCVISILTRLSLLSGAFLKLSQLNAYACSCIQYSRDCLNQEMLTFWRRHVYCSVHQKAVLGYFRAKFAIKITERTCWLQSEINSLNLDTYYNITPSNLLCAAIFKVLFDLHASQTYVSVDALFVCMAFHSTWMFAGCHIKQYVQNWADLPYKINWVTSLWVCFVSLPAISVYIPVCLIPM